MATATARVNSSVVRFPGSCSGCIPVSLMAWSTLSRIGVYPGAFATGGLAYEILRPRGFGTVGVTGERDGRSLDVGSTTRGSGVSLRDGVALSMVVTILGLWCRAPLGCTLGISLW